MQVAIMNHKLTNLLSVIALLSEEDVQKLFIEVSKFPTIHVCMITKMQELYFKLDFANAYDKISWRFLFHTMQILGITTKIIN